MRINAKGSISAFGVYLFKTKLIKRKNKESPEKRQAYYTFDKNERSHLAKFFDCQNYFSKRCEISAIPQQYYTNLDEKNFRMIFVRIKNSLSVIIITMIVKVIVIIIVNNFTLFRRVGIGVLNSQSQVYSRFISAK